MSINQKKERHNICSVMYAAVSAESGHPRPAQMKKKFGVRKTMNVFNHHPCKERIPRKKKEYPWNHHLREPLLLPTVAYLLGSMV